MKFSALQAVLLCLGSALRGGEGHDVDVDALANMTSAERRAHLQGVFAASREEALTGRKPEEKEEEEEDCDPDEKVARKLEAEALTERNRGVIVEVHNCAAFLSEVSAMLGKEGPAFFDMEIRRDRISAKPVNPADEGITANISDEILGKPIGEEGVPITLDIIIEELVAIHRRLGRIERRGMKIFIIPGEDAYLEYSIDLLEAISHLLGKPGPIWFEHGIVEISNRDADIDAVRRASQAPLPVPDEDGVGYARVELEGELLRVPVGQKGKAVTVDDFVDAFSKVSTNPALEAYRKSGRSYFHEGFFKREEGPATLVMVWGS